MLINYRTTCVARHRNRHKFTTNRIKNIDFKKINQTFLLASHGGKGGAASFVWFDSGACGIIVIRNDEVTLVSCAEAIVEKSS